MSNFSQILTFIEVANTRSFAEASRRLSLSTSTVSARVKALEERMNVRLLNRNTRNVSLTDEGEVYLINCQQTIEELLKVEEDLSQATRLSGRIKMTIPQNLPMSNFAKIIGDFKDTHDQVSIDVIVTDEPIDLVSNNVDLAIRGGKPGGFSLVSRKIGEGKLSFVSSLTFRKQKSEGDVAFDLNETVIFDPLEILPSLPESWAYRRGQLDTHDLELVKHFVLQSHGVGLLPKGICLTELEKGDLVLVPSKITLPTLPLYLVYPSRNQLPARVRSFIDFLFEAQDKCPLVY